MAKKKQAAKRLRKARQLWAKQAGKCFYCGCSMHLSRGPKDGICSDNLATLDHYIPRSQGGSNDLSNLVAACYRCNTLRSDAPAPAFIIANAAWRALFGSAA